MVSIHRFVGAPHAPRCARELRLFVRVSSPRTGPPPPARHNVRLRMTSSRSLAAALLAALLFTGCAGLDQTAQRDLELAAVDLGDQLEAPGLLAAATLLYHEVNGRYPATPFELLGSPAAHETGLRQLGLSALRLAPEDDGLAIRYTLL